MFIYVVVVVVDIVVVVNMMTSILWQSGYNDEKSFIHIQKSEMMSVIINLLTFAPLIFVVAKICKKSCFLASFCVAFFLRFTKSYYFLLVKFFC